MMAVLSRRSSVHSIPACVIASRAANTENCAKPVHKIQRFPLKVVIRIESEDGGAIFKFDLIHSHLRDRTDVLRDGTDAGAPTGQ